MSVLLKPHKLWRAIIKFLMASLAGTHMRFLAIIQRYSRSTNRFIWRVHRLVT